MTLPQESPNKIRLCGCNSNGCPTIELIEDDYILIEDDFGQSVKIKKEEAALISEALGYFE